MQQMQVWSLGWEGSLEKEMATCLGILAWRIPWTEEPDGLQSLGLQKSQTWLKWLSTCAWAPEPDDVCLNPHLSFTSCVKGALALSLCTSCLHILAFMLRTMTVWSPCSPCKFNRAITYARSYTDGLCFWVETHGERERQRVSVCVWKISLQSNSNKMNILKCTNLMKCYCDTDRFASVSPCTIRSHLCWCWWTLCHLCLHWCVW